MNQRKEGESIRAIVQKLDRKQYNNVQKKSTSVLSNRHQTGRPWTTTKVDEGNNESCPPQGRGEGITIHRLKKSSRAKL